MAVYAEGLLWGCPQMNFKANPPFNEMRQGFATFKKETRMAPQEIEIYPHFLRCYDFAGKRADEREFVQRFISRG
jgi:hypothetical protein